MFVIENIFWTSMHPAPRLLTLAFSVLAFATAAQAQATQAVGAGQVLLAPRTADNSPPPAIGLTDAMKDRAVPTNQWSSGLIFNPQPEVLFAQPYSVKAPASGFEMALPTRVVIPTERQDTEIHYPHRNPLVNVVSSLRGHNVTLLSTLPNFISINSAIEVDLTGQINAESVGTQQISGVGGSIDYVETAYQSIGGRRITVIPSTAKGGAKSSIVPRLGEGTTISVPRSMADVIVTEHGVADLRGKSTRERAEAMCRIADPQFRDDLDRFTKSH
jgi:hypothetical protein